MKKMNATKAASLVLGLVLCVGVFASQSHADTFNKKTNLTFSQAVEVPGQVLPAGKYTLTVLDSPGSRNIVQIWNADKTQLITTILAIPNYRLRPTSQTVIEFHERPSASPQALKAWFYPGDHFGIEFVYPKKEAIRIAQAANEVVPAEAEELTTSTLETVPLIAITAEQKEEPIAEAFQTAPESVTVAQELPKTASQAPMFALLGLVCLVAGLGVKRFAVKTL